MPEPTTIATNIPEFSVSDLALSLKRTLEETYGRVRVRGELSKVMIAGSGHWVENDRPAEHRRHLRAWLEGRG